MNKYRKLRNRVLTQLRASKATYFKQINPRDAKQFWKAVKYLNKSKTSIPALSRDDTTAHSDEEKAAMISEYFSTCFNSDVPPLSPTAGDPPERVLPEDYLCTIDEVFHLLVSLDTSKSSGPDGISARMLKMTAISIAPSVTNLFNLSLRLGHIPANWKHSSIVPIPKNTTGTSPQDYRPISLLVS